MRIILILACLPWGTFGAIRCSGAEATPAAAPAAQAAARSPMTRNDVDLLLRQARSAIQESNFEQADALVRRAEGAHIHYSLFHLGHTPSSVRRELERARHAQRPAGQKPSQPEAARPRLPMPWRTGDRASEETADPFVARNQAMQRDAALPSLPTTQSPQQTIPNGELAVGAAATAYNQAAVPPSGQQVLNPFAAQPRSLAVPAHFEDQAKGAYPIAQTGWDADSDAAAAATNANPYPTTGQTAGEDASWQLPDAPLPRGAEARSLAQGVGLAGPGPSLTPPPRASDVAQAIGGLDVSNLPPKEQALAHMNAARSALGSGDIDLAEELARAASAVGVPESQFLPDEDRPSLVAWDIVRARQNHGGAQPAAARLPAADSRGASQPTQPATSIAPVLASPYPTTVAAAPENNDRWATLPEPLTLPAESSSSANASPPIRYPETAPTAAPRNPMQIEAPVASQAPAANMNQATQLLRAGEAALERHERDSALELFEQAHAMRQQLAPADRERLQDRLQMLASEPIDTTVTPRMAAVPPSEPQALQVPPTVVTDTDQPPGAVEMPARLDPDAASLIDAADESVQVVARQLSAEVSKRQSEAQRLSDTDPERAVAILREAQQMVERSKLPESSRRELLSRIDITLGKTQKFIDDHRHEIDLDKQNEAVMSEVERRREVKLKVDQKKAELINEFNTLRDEQRYAEMEIVAKRLIEMAPDDELARQTYQTAKFIRREMMNRDVQDKRENSNWLAWHDVELSSINPVAESGKELVYIKEWNDLVKNRKGSRERTERRTERELEIERRLRTPVLLRYQDTPLTEVVDGLSELTGVNIHIDPRGLEQEGYTADTKVTVNLNKEISLKSALNLILEPLHLSYVIKDEVLKITSEQLRDGEIYPITYNVADLVIPIPNFVPNNNIGLQGLINDAHAAMGYGHGFGTGGPAVLVNDRGKQRPAAGNDQVLAQQFNAAPAAGGLSPATVPIGAGPGGMGGGANADFDSLIDLIVSTVSTDTWAENGGGEAEIRPFPTNLSLVISQTQAVHEEIADLLEQLRRLQDLQVTIEVRFIRLNDRFFERIGIDFDVNIEDRTIGTADLIPGSVFEGGRQSATVGLQQPAGVNVAPNFTTDLDIPFRQGSFSVAVPPPFAGFDPNAAANFGFAILSDIEAYFLIEAAQGDSRTNVLNAPKVTLFNGQQAFVADAVSQPFVIGVIPVVGEFVAAQQPVIVVLNEGTMMTIQAVVSDDRRYVRLTVVPFFTQIGDVQEFTFEGTSSTSRSSSSTDDDDDGKNESSDDNEEQSRSGVTVQLPAFQFVSVVTTVSVPDGGTVLLGGIKRLSEGRSEFGVPLLSKVPYINRLFRNVGIGRDTDSLMMMVTPRIIIQEEEEERLGIAVP